MDRRTHPLPHTTRPDTPRRRHALWLGPVSGTELRLARSGLECDVDLIDVASPEAAVGAVAALGVGIVPAFAILAADRPGRSTATDALLLSRSFPLLPLVSVASSLVDGRRRSGPPLPGVEEVPWHDLPGRCRWWLAALEAGLQMSLGLPATCRREERLLESMGGIGICARATEPGRGAFPMLSTDVSVVARRSDDLDGLCELLTFAGLRVTGRRMGRPDVDETAGALIWDAGDLAAMDLDWLRILAANRPHVFTVLLVSFPRGDAVAAALQAGAAAVLGRPVCLEAILGTLLGRPVWKPVSTGRVGLGGAVGRR